MAEYSDRDAVIVGAVRTPVGKGKANGALHDVLPADLLAHSLRELVDAGLLAKRPYREPGQRSRDEYVLTESGTAFMPVVWAMFEWGRKFLSDSRLRLAHHDCGAEATVEIRCTEGHHVPLDELAVRYERGPR